MSDRSSESDAAFREVAIACEAAEFAAAAARRAEFYSLPPEAVVDRQTMCAVRYIGEGTAEAEAIKGGGPRYMRIGRRALYRKADVLAWMESNARTVENTAQLSEAAA
jgi:hypothetical protein